MNFNYLITLFGSRMKSLEIILLLDDQKQVVRQGFYDHELKKVEEFCNKHDLFMSKSKFKVKLEEKEEFSNKGTVVNQDDHTGMSFIYLSKDEEQAALANLAETTQNHKELGTLLGYPTCCIEFFLNVFSPSNTNPTRPPMNPWTNLSQRKHDLCLISHFPCANDCQESIQQAKNNYELLLKHDPPMAQLFFQGLSSF